jgi:hypothetical protein
VVSPYEDFFIASAGASAAILGLLVVAIAVVNADDGNPTTRELRTVLAGSAFVALADSRSGALQRALVLVLAAMYCSALARTWEVTGITRRAPSS